jgi:hypothetical protein
VPCSLMCFRLFRMDARPAIAGGGPKRSRVAKIFRWVAINSLISQYVAAAD